MASTVSDEDRDRLVEEFEEIVEKALALGLSEGEIETVVWDCLR